MSTFFQMGITQAFSLKNQCLSDINVHGKGYGKDTEKQFQNWYGTELYNNGFAVEKNKDIWVLNNGRRR